MEILDKDDFNHLDNEMDVADIKRIEDEEYYDVDSLEEMEKKRRNGKI